MKNNKGFNHYKFTFARKCDACGCGMNEGYVLFDGEQYYCDKKCLNTKFSNEEWIAIYDADDGYYTEWERDDCQYVMRGGVLVDIDEPVANLRSAYPALIMHEQLRLQGYFDRYEIDALDAQWERACEHYKWFVDGWYKKVTTSEYDCIVEYVKSRMKVN